MSQLVIFLHGVGSNGADLAGLGEAWRGVLPNAAFAAPDAPFRFDMGGPGRQWFSVQGVTAQNRLQRVAEARPAFDAVLNGIVAQHKMQDRLDQVTLVGFSQGSIMALDAVASGRWPVGAVVAFAGRLASLEPLTPSTKTPVLLVHGDADQVMPVQEAALAQQHLERAGVTVERFILPGVGQTISAQGGAKAVEFLKGVFG